MPANRLFFCEKPSQARDIAGVLGATSKGDGCLRGNGVIVTWGFGHLLEQAPPQAYDPELKRWSLESLPILPTAWKQEVKTSAKKQFGVVKKLLKEAGEVVVATDADREGEVIAREVLDECGYSGKISRLWLSALDEASIRKALNEIRPGSTTLPLYHAGLGRSRADWLVGMNLTRAFTIRAQDEGYDGVLSVGRVQTPTLKLVVERDLEIANFVPKPFWELVVTFQAQAGSFKAKWLPQDDSLLDAEGRCINQQAAQQLAKQVQHGSGVIAQAESRRKKEGPPLALDLASLQQEGSRRWGYGAQQVLDIAQSLYETHKATTYPRTDCRYLPVSQHSEAQQVVKALLQSDEKISGVVERLDLQQKSRIWNDSKITAHHGIIPTTAPCQPQRMSEAEWNVYDLVRRHYLAQFLPQHEYDQTDVRVDAAGESFGASGKKIVVTGWKALFPPAGDDDDEGAKGQQELPALQQGEQCGVSEASVVDKKTTPPKPFTEGTLISAMKNAARFVTNEKLKARLKETAGIGTEATRAGIIETLISRGFLKKQKRALVSTPTAQKLVAQLPPMITDPGMTALWEQALDGVANGEQTLEDFMARQHTLIERLVQQASQATLNLPVEETPPCPECGGRTRLRKGDYGSFYSCRRYPDCKGRVDAGGKKKRRQRGKGKAAAKR